MTARRFVLVTFVVNLAMAVVAALACLAFGGLRLFAGAGVGGLAGAVNLYVLGMIGIRMFSPDARKPVTAALLVAKTLVLVALAFAAIAMLSVSGLGLAIGITTTVVSVLLTSSYVTLRGAGIQL